MMNWRNPKWTADGRIDCEIMHPQFGWIPFTLDPSDTAAGFDVAGLDAAIRAAGGIAPYVPPDPAIVLAAQRQGMTMTFAQLLIGLVAEEWITEAEGEAWLSGTLPQAVLDLISTLPASQRFPARARAVAPSVILRLDPLVIALAAAQSKTPEELDTFFTTYAGV